jgi:CheY-like chemotaxis protein
MDIQLPIMDGYEATRRIKADASLRAIPIIAVTSYALSGEGQKERPAAMTMCRSVQPSSVAGENSAVSVPIARSQLLQVIGAAPGCGRTTSASAKPLALFVLRQDLRDRRTSETPP